MPKKTHPSYRLHKRSGQAIVTWENTRAKQVIRDKYGLKGRYGLRRSKYSCCFDGGLGCGCILPKLTVFAKQAKVCDQVYDSQK